MTSDLSANGYNLAAMTWLECVTYIKEKDITITLSDTHAHAPAWTQYSEGHCPCRPGLPVIGP